MAQEQPPSWWSPAPGDILAGVVTEQSEVDTKYGPRRTAKIRTAAGELVKLLITGVVLESEWDKADPQDGDSVSLGFLGIPEGKQYKVYRLCVDQRANPSPPKRTDTEIANTAAARVRQARRRPRPDQQPPASFQIRPMAQTRGLELPQVNQPDPFEW